MTDFILDDFLPYQLAVLSNRISDQFSQSYRDKFGISVPEWRLVAHLSQSEKTSIREVNEKVQMDKSKASRAAARLVKAGYINKKVDPADRRLVELSLTAKGRTMMEEIGPKGTEFQNEIVAHLSTKEREIFLNAIRAMLEKYT